VSVTHKFPKQSCVGIFRNECSRSNHWTQNSCFGAFRTISLLHIKVGVKRAKLVLLTYKFAKRSASEFFAMTSPDPLHWTQNSCFRAFRIVSLMHETWCKTGWIGATNAQVFETKLRRNFSHQMHPIHSIGPKLKFYDISDCFITAKKSVQNGPNWCH
jgi:hypothetical protein